MSETEPADAALATPPDPSPSRPPGDESRARAFEEVQHDELEAIGHLRELRRRRAGRHGAAALPEPVPSRPRAPDATDRAHRSGLLGLCCSGGGIRSATFHLGVVQALAKLGLLSRLDYLCTNSGGGYLGGWLVAWIQRAGARRVEAELGGTGLGDAPEPRPVRFLRSFSNYLTPRAGLFSADTWTLVATYLRNLFLNLLILVLTLSALLLIPRLLLLLSGGIGNVTGTWSPTGLPFPLLLAISFLAVGVFFMGRNQMRLFPRLDRSPTPWYAHQTGVQLTVVLPLMLAGWAGALWMWFSVPPDTSPDASPDAFTLADWLAERGLPAPGLGDILGDLLTWVLLAALVYTAVWLMGYLAFLLRGLRAHRDSSHRRQQRLWRVSVVTALPAGAGGGFMLWLLLEGTYGLESLLRPGHFERGFHLLHVTAVRGPLIVVIFMLTAFLHTGLLGRELPESLRQWWSRLGAWLLIYCFAWVAFCSLAFYGGMALELLGSLVVLALGICWLGSTLLGLLAGSRDSSSPSGARRIQRLVSALAPYVFIVGLLALLSLGLQLLLSPAAAQLTEGCSEPWMRAGNGEPFLDFTHRVIGCHSERLWKGTDPVVVPGLLLALAAAALLLSWRVDINEFSMHLFYRNRLIRAYLGASNPNRRAQSFTGFDPEDDLDLAQLVPRGMDPPACPEVSRSRADRSTTKRDSSYDGPYPILNLTLNLVKGEELAWQERKAASFVCTPLYTGYPHERVGEPETRPTSPLAHAGFRPTRCYLQPPPRQGISLGTAMAISGAAASPHQGAATTPAMAFLLTVFNVRLGWWLGNPRHRDTWYRMGPRVGLLTLMAELFGYSGEDSRYVYLSDGGHFDNCALYEMVRRRARYIVAIDAEADSRSIFPGLADAIRKCSVDFGVEIELDTRPITEGPAHCVVGRIRYDRVDPGAEPGWILYLKASLNGDEPRDVQSYAAAHPTFPHEPTADQWFSESQLESYRKLGRHIAMAAFRPLSPDGEEGRARLPDAVRDLTTRELFERLHDAWGASPEDDGG